MVQRQRLQHRITSEGSADVVACSDGASSLRTGAGATDQLSVPCPSPLPSCTMQFAVSNEPCESQPAADPGRPADLRTRHSPRHLDVPTPKAAPRLGRCRQTASMPRPPACLAMRRSCAAALTRGDCRQRTTPAMQLAQAIQRSTAHRRNWQMQPSKTMIIGGS
eukprot:364109-Chlamydomonas_euryale.AAC.10